MRRAEALDFDKPRKVRVAGGALNGPEAAAMGTSEKKIDAIFKLRTAAEEKALAEKAATDDPSPENRDKLLDCQLDLEAKTVSAIDVCHECGHEHLPDAPHLSPPREHSHLHAHFDGTIHRHPHAHGGWDPDHEHDHNNDDAAS
ncbi:MAG: hypothetical protein WA431_05935 [Candidatus Cybelea sp.]